MNDQHERLREALAGRYELQRELGSGGMATVYLAEDLKHHRQVAVKVLRPEVARALGAERFLREIEIAAQLHHPHVLPLYDSGEADGFLYFVMPYIEGESLRDRLNRDKQLPIDHAVRIGREVADALSYAHGHGVVHRDIKPENIMLDSEHAVVADFGVAKAFDTASTDALTETGIALGTPIYMSPEQAGASRDVDARSDIYSLGCVLFEMLAGQPPFSGPTVESILRQHITSDAPPVTTVRASVPSQLKDAIGTALEKTPADRFQSADDFKKALAEPRPMRSSRGGVPPLTASRRKNTRLLALALAAVLVVAVLILTFRAGDATADLDQDAVVVLPFRVSGDASLQPLREGMLDLIHAKFTGDGIPRAVHPRTVLSAWRREVVNEGDDLAVEASLDIAADVGAAKLLLGSVVGVGADVTMVGEVWRVPDGEVLASASVTNTGDSLILLTDQFVARLLSRLGGEAEDRVGDLTTRSWPALQEYLAAQQLYRRGRYQEARDRFGAALELDSTFALAALGRRTSSLLTGQTRDASQRAWALRDRLSERDRKYLEAYRPQSAREDILTAQAAVDLAPDHPEALGRLGYMLHSRGPYVDWPDAQGQAAEVLNRTIALDSSYAYPMEIRLRVAFLTGDTTHVRHLSDRLWRSDSTSDRAGYYRWRAAYELGDSAVVRTVRDSFAQLRGFGNLISFTILDGLPADDAEQAAAARLESATTNRPNVMELGRARLAVAQGRVGVAVATFDSTLRLGHGDAAEHLLDVALMDPGYDSAAAAVVEKVDPSTIQSPVYRIQYLCKRALWRLERGDTSVTADNVAQITQLSAELGVRTACPLLVEARLESLDTTRGHWPAFERLDSLMREGRDTDFATNVANLYIAEWREAQGDYAGALAAVRRRYYRSSWMEPIALAAFLRREGRLATLVGDTLGAIRAYDHYLRVRTAPDPGPMQDEVEHVKAELARLVREPGQN